MRFMGISYTVYLFLYIYSKIIQYFQINYIYLDWKLAVLLLSAVIIQLHILFGFALFMF